MSQEIRRELISRNLGIIPINHGKVYTFQIAIPDAEKQEISLERSQAIESSLLQHQSNLVSLILRRTQSYGDDIEYELVYGADWLQVAQKLDIEMLWAWVFDMTDEQAVAAKPSFSQLFGSLVSMQGGGSPQSADSADLEQMIDRKLQVTADSIKQVLAASLDKFKEAFDEKLKTLHYSLEHRTGSFSDIPELSELSTQLAQLREQIESVGMRATGSRPKVLPPFEGTPIHLLTASDSEIADLLNQVGAQKKEIASALRALAYWKQPERTLTWENLERSAAKIKSDHKVSGFAKGTFDRLRQIGIISADEPSTAS